MRSLRTDLIVAALIVSVIVHVGLMIYVRPMVMTRVMSVSRSSGKRGPMRVVRSKERPEPVKIDAVTDVKPLKDAPQAEKTVSSVPSAETALPSGDENPAVVPEAPMPEFKELISGTDELPEVRTAPESPLTVRAPAMISAADAPKPAAALSKMPTVSADPVAAPVLDLAVPVLAATPSVAAERETVVDPLPKEDRKEDEKPFEPSAEVMEKVDEKFVEAEKSAVRELVNVADAKDLSKAVDVRFVRAVAADATYFRVTIAPKAGLATVPKDVVVLIDASGSIGKDRMGSIRGAAKRILRSAANTGDRFNLVAFRDRYTYAFRTWQNCTESSFAAADRWLGNVAPFGRTDVFATITSVLTLPRDPSRPLVALVVTDGEANSGVSDTADILSKFTVLNDGLISLYMYGVKATANRELIEVLTRLNRGEGFVFKDSSWFARARAGEGLEGLSNRFRDPVLSDLRVVYASDCAAESYPRLLRNLHRGGTVELLGRLPKGAKEVAFSLKGLNGRTAYEGYFRFPLESAPSDPSVAAAWAAERTIDNRLR